MNIKHLLRKLRLNGKEFITDLDLKEYCSLFELTYADTVAYLLRKKYLIRIFRGIFYVRSVEEVILGRSKYSHFQLVARGLELKKIENWYFGLHTALKLNNMTHEYFAIEDVLSDTLFRAAPISIAGHKFRFTKISSSLMDFGILKDRGIRFSDPEKTILDFIYIWRYRGLPHARIVEDVSEWADTLNTSRFRRYSRNYPQTVVNITEEVIHVKR